MIEVDFAKGFATFYTVQILTIVVTEPIIRPYSEPV